MSDKYMKNIDYFAVLTMAELVNYQTGQVVSKTLVQNKNLSLTLFAFDKGEEISSHDSTGDAMVVVLDGSGEITIADKKYSVNKGETIIMPAKVPHAVYASEQFKMLLLVVFSPQ